MRLPVPSENSVRRWAPAPFVVTVLAYTAQVALEAPTKSFSSALMGMAFIVPIVLFPLVGWLILRQQPGNRIGLLLGAIGLTWAVIAAGTVYADLARRTGLPGGNVVAVVETALWAPPILMMTFFLILLFPHGRLPSPRWRIPAWIVAVDAALLPVGLALSPGSTETDVGTITNPIGWQAGKPLLIGLLIVGLPLVPISVVTAAVNLVLRFRRSTGVDRLQVKWLMSAGAAVAVVYGAVTGMSLAYLTHTPAWVENLQAPSALAFVLIPIAIGVAITRHGLYGIDALISRALTVAVLGGLITAVYVGVVVGLGSAIGQRHPSVWLSVLATALVAIAFQPARERVRLLVNRLVYGTRATPYQVLSDFAGQLAGRFTTGELLPRLAQTVTESLGGGRVEIWLRTADGFTREASWPAGAAQVPSPVPEAEVGSDAPGWAVRLPGPAVFGADRVVPVMHRDELLGAICVSTHAHEPLTPTDQAMLQQVASQAGLVLRNLRLVEDLQRSRQRLVTSQDNERRRLERDLHDGAQQSLVAVAIQLHLAAAQDDDRAVSDTLAGAAAQLATAIAELRELAHGIHPAVLTERGLGPALQSLAGRSAVPVQVKSDLERRLPPTMEATLYFVVAEALANVGKYAQARQVRVTVRDAADQVIVTVQDDGVGGAELARGTGLLGLTDRLAVVDGTLELDSPPGRGTLLTCRVPVTQNQTPHNQTPHNQTQQNQAAQSEAKVLQAPMSPALNPVRNHAARS